MDGTESKVTKGEIKKIVIENKRRQGNKSITKISNLEVYGIDAVKFASKGQSVYVPFLIGCTDLCLVSDIASVVRQLLNQHPERAT